MNIKYICCFFLLLYLKPVKVYSQNYHYIHYTTTDGLASNTVYDVVQDENGFMYFATENGLSRFDGKNWKTFTVKDGLPDNEVLKLFIDSKKRIWIATFGGLLSRIIDNKIVIMPFSQNTKKSYSVFSNMHEDKLGRIFFRSSELILKFENDSLKTVFSSKEVYGKLNRKDGYVHSLLKDGILMILCNGKLYSYLDKVTLLNDYVENFTYKYEITKTKHLVLKEIPNSLHIDKNTGKRIISTNQGAFIIDTIHKKINNFLPNKKVGTTITDLEGNIWFTTLNEGVYKIQNENFNYYNITQNQEGLEVFSLAKSKSVLYSGFSLGKILQKQKNDSKIFDYVENLNPTTIKTRDNRVLGILTVSDHLSLFCFDNYLLKKESNKDYYNYALIGNKSIDKLDENKTILGSKYGVFIVNNNNLQIIDTLFSDRSTYGSFFENDYYIGTLQGLYKVTQQRKQTYLGILHPSLKRRITCIKKSSDTLFVATADSGIVLLKSNKVIQTITETNGLTSNICKTIFIRNGKAYIGTVKGLNIFNFNTNRIEQKFTESDGLPSNLINTVIVDDSDKVYLGTQKGLVEFRPKEIISKSMCNLIVENVFVNGFETNLNKENNLRYNDIISFHYLGISHKSADDILYFYKLDGFNNNFQNTLDRSISYQALPDGRYTLTLYAQNKFGVKSKQFKYSFIVNPPFWKTWWFYSLEIAIIIGSTWLILYLRFKKKKNELQRNAEIQLQLANMEQLALQSQMNPHFVFNSLNSIQQFILKNDKLLANRYLSSFATLIRKTLDYSAQKNISLSNEIEYLKIYLNLELMRFENSFTYELIVDEDLESDLIKIPALLFQPYVENAIRHGIRNKKTNDGRIVLKFALNDDTLVCTITDNGVGRKKAMEIKSQSHVEYQGKGMEITKKRIDLLNLEYKSKIELKIIDLYNDNLPTGTLVQINIPI